MHIEVFHAAKEHLEQNFPFQVVGGYISPCDDAYVSSKIWKGFIPAPHRYITIDLIKLKSQRRNVSKSNRIR
jgi:hypothetical protein